MKHEVKVHIFITLLGVIFLAIGNGSIISMAGGLCVMIFPIQWMNNYLKEDENVH